MPIAYASYPKSVGSEDIHSAGDFLLLAGELTFSGSYATGGEVPSPTFADVLKRIGAGQVMFVLFSHRAGYLTEFDPATGKVLVRQGAGSGAPAGELAAAGYPAGLTGLTAGNRVKVLVFGR